MAASGHIRIRTSSTLKDSRLWVTKAQALICNAAPSCTASGRRSIPLAQPGDFDSSLNHIHRPPSHTNTAPVVNEASPESK